MAERRPGLAGPRGRGTASGACGFRACDAWSEGARWNWALPAGQVLPWGEGLGEPRTPRELLFLGILLRPGQRPLHSVQGPRRGPDTALSLC